MILTDNNPYTGRSFSNKNRLLRFMWLFVWMILFRPTPRAMHAWRNFLLKAFGAKIGIHTHVHETVRIWAPWNLQLDNYIGVGEYVNIYNMAMINISDYTVVSQGTHLCTGSHDFNTSNFQLIAEPIVVDCRVWLCADSFVGPGVTIAEGSVVAARGVVSKSIIEPWCVWAGVPVKKIGFRDKQKVLG